MNLISVNEFQIAKTYLKTAFHEKRFNAVYEFLESRYQNRYFITS
jgi:hypothetical protein